MAPARVWLFAAVLFVPVTVGAQAWLPAEGNLGASVLYTDLFDTKHYLPDGEELDSGPMRVHSVGLSLSYAPTDRIFVTAGVPYVRSEYHGAFPHPTDVDDGDFHGTFTDVRVEVHYQVALDPVAFAPYVALVEPTHNYPALGHAAPGRNLEEKWVGFFVGKSLDLWIPRVYVQARYVYAFVEKVAGTGHDRSNLDLEIGYFPHPAWSVRALAFWQYTHGGINVPIPKTDPLFPYHDQLAAERFLNIGAGSSYDLSTELSLFGLYTTSVHGANGHKLGRSFTLGFGYSFQPR
jgi:hypothetical protein